MAEQPQRIRDVCQHSAWRMDLDACGLCGITAEELLRRERPVILEANPPRRVSTRPAPGRLGGVYLPESYMHAVRFGMARLASQLKKFADGQSSG